QPDCGQGVVFDGFPRTEAQARALDAALGEESKRINGVIYVNVHPEVLVERLSARWICPNDGAVYNMLTNPPRVKGRCDKDNGELYQRDDDKPETVRRRLQVYQKQTQPLIDYYRTKGLLHELNGEQNIEKVQEDLVKVVQGL
ncbi:MAG: nucleoside monophosphate kinase, partial [Chloroflexi bacterium]|nr:nucleoside monophosphate kinase [Chloroflexota bacterium]